MRKKILIVYSIIFLLLSIILFYYFLYNIYGNEIRKEPANLYADFSSKMKIEVIPVNALGWKALLRNSSSKFEVIEGMDLIDIINKNEAKGILTISSKGKTGIVGIKIKSEHSLFSEYIEIEILPLTA